MTKTVLILGASSGIGEALAKTYAQAGWQVGITGRRADKLQQLADAFPGQMKCFPFDVTAPDASQNMEKALLALGEVEVIVYNAGVGEANKYLDEEIELNTVAVNVAAFTRLILVGYHYFEKRGIGTLAGVSSVASRRGDGGSPAYNASKAYMSNYMEGLRKKAFRRKLQLTVTDIRPGFVDTAMAQGEGLFWKAPVDKAAVQIKNALDQRKSVVYITKRWFIIAKILEWLPAWLWHRV
jgi:short-subunit dehydrogenase